MANEAHKEPTMEEILASIRKIIADDTPPSGSSSSAKSGATGHRKEAAFDNDADIGMFEGDVEPDFGRTDEVISGPEFSFEEMLGTARSFEAPREAPVAPVAPQTLRKSPPQQKSPESPMPASIRHANDPLTDDHIADAAAGSLGKLISRMDLGSDNTIEGLVRELLKPMIKEWLDANLARIVEEKVEAEVERIARMVR